MAIEAHKICQEWLENMDEYIKRNLYRLTCNNVREIYFALFGELKRWRSNSSGFTGFSEFLIFRILYHMIGEKFEAIETGDIGTDPIIFRSENYEIGQNVKMVLDGTKKFPDIYVKRKGKLISIIQVKIVTGGGEPQIAKEVETFRLFRNSYPDIKGLFIVLIKDTFTEHKNQRLTNAGYRTIVLQDNHKLISDVLKEVI
jgi:hypothetical protein